jgi:ABC-type lipoprotein release transport system permease subunit
VKIKPEYTFKRGRKEQITVTYLDIGIEQLKQSGMLQVYRNEHNKQIHHFSQEGKTMAWIPAQKLNSYLSAIETQEFVPQQVEEFIKYGFDKISATVSKKGMITYNNHRYYVAVGAEKFSRHQSTKVYISELDDKLLIFDHKHDGVFLAEALAQKAPQKPKRSSQPKLPANEVEQIAEFLQNKGMLVDPVALIDKYRNGLTLAVATDIYDNNKSRYENYALKLDQSKQRLGLALFNAFLIDCQRYQRRTHVAPYAAPAEQQK